MARSELFRLGCWLVLWLGLSACKASENVASTCSLAKGQVVARRDALAFHAIKLLPLRGELSALWSDAQGLWWRRLDLRGAPLAAPTRLTDDCAGGMDALQAGSGLWLACSRPLGRGSEEGELRVYRFDTQGRVVRDVVVGKTGRDGQGVSLSGEGTRLNVVFHEGSWGRHVIHRARLENDLLVQSEVISDERRIAGDPASLVDEGHHYAVWRESQLASEPETSTTIWIKADDAPARRVLDTRVVETMPSLSRDGSGLLLAYRDQRPRDKRPELYLTRLSGSLGPLSSPVRVGRANGQGAPRLARCGAVHAAVLPREYGGEHYVAVHELDGQLANRGGGHQYYANTREFVQASATCVGAAGQGELTLLIGERAQPAKPGVELMTLRFSCR